MKKSQVTIIKAFLASVFIAGMGVFSAAVLAEPVAANTESIDGVLLASTDFKGAHRYTTHTAYERHFEKNQLVQVDDQWGVVPVLFKGKPPYNRHLAEQKSLEKAQFAQLEDGAGVVSAAHYCIYRGAQGKRPPYKR